MGSLDESPADILRYLLVALGHGVLPVAGGNYSNGVWPIYVDGEPSAPDETVTLYDTEGRDSGRDMVGGSRFEHHGVQVRVRGKDHASAYAKARRLAISMDVDLYQENVEVGDNRYIVQCVDRQGDVLRLGRDAPNSNRRLFTVNVMVVVRQLAEGEDFPEVLLLLEDSVGDDDYLLTESGDILVGG